MDFEALAKARADFDALVADVRPQLLRYCARMTGSAVDGEDIVQEALAKVYFRLPQLGHVENLRAWLFRVAHNKALDYLRRYDVRFGETLEGELPSPEREQFDQHHIGIELVTKREQRVASRIFPGSVDGPSFGIEKRREILVVDAGGWQLSDVHASERGFRQPLAAVGDGNLQPLGGHRLRQDLGAPQMADSEEMLDVEKHASRHHRTAHLRS